MPHLIPLYFADDTYILYTDPLAGDYKFGHFSTYRNFFIFAVKACSNAHLRLAATPEYDVGIHDAFELSVGTLNNSCTELSLVEFRTGSVRQNFTETPGILDCDDYRDFWISWDNQRVRFGEGELYLNEVIYLDTENDVNIHFIETATGVDIEGWWSISKHQGREVSKYAYTSCKSAALPITVNS